MPEGTRRCTSRDIVSIVRIVHTAPPVLDLVVVAPELALALVVVVDLVVDLDLVVVVVVVDLVLDLVLVAVALALLGCTSSSPIAQLPWSRSLCEPKRESTFFCNTSSTSRAAFCAFSTSLRVRDTTPNHGEEIMSLIRGTLSFPPTVTVQQIRNRVWLGLIKGKASLSLVLRAPHLKVKTTPWLSYSALTDLSLVQHTILLTNTTDCLILSTTMSSATVWYSGLRSNFACKVTIESGLKPRLDPLEI